ncbi:hypothetical protein [Rhizorhapis sp. SPR117]|uniref:hypothetical protein n=1 Tax=Rhizorhapis sp. SPR117 TaxID=2912611 RepID=UPI001F26C61B|nr:hypothetical protein [Rhizorhapis sp. SPR117]
MAKIEIEIDDALLARAAATGRTVQELGAEGFSMAVTSCEFDQRIDEWMREEQEKKQTRAAERAAWAAATRPEIVESYNVLRAEWREKSDREREAAFVLTEEQAATFAWLALVTDAWTETRPFDGLRIDLDNPAHWQAATKYARRALYQHFKRERFDLEGGTHPLLFREKKGDAEPSGK